MNIMPDDKAPLRASREVLSFVYPPPSPPPANYKNTPPLVPAAMNYQNFLESGQGPNSNNRQAPNQNQAMNHAAGINGNAVGLPGVMTGLPTPAGQQADLNYIMNMVNELATIHESNRQSTERIVEAAGRVRQVAQENNLTNEEILETVSKELNDTTKNLEVEVSQLSKKLEKAEAESKENLDIAYQYAKVMGNMLDRLHAFKLKTVEDTCAWHRNYRDQLAFERQKNVELNFQIQDMQAHAAKGAEALRNFRREWDGSPAYFKWMSIAKEKTLLARSYKRMAFPYADDNDKDFFSDDDDLVDPEEKKRLAREDMARLEKQKADRLARAAAAADVTSTTSAMSQTNIAID